MNFLRKLFGLKQATTVPSSDEQPSVKPPDQAEPLAVLERKLTGHKNWVHSVAVSPDGTWAASGSWDKTVKIWDLETGQCRATLEGHTGRVQSVAITPDGKRILSGSGDKTVRVWDAESGREVAKLKGHTNEVWSVVALRDSARALSGGFDQTLRLWELASGKCLKTIECKYTGYDDVFATAVNPAGTQALSGHCGGRVQLWNLDWGGGRLATLRGHSDDVKSVQITPDGRFAVSGSNDKTVKVWNLDAATCVGTLGGHEGHVDSVAISPDGTLIASTGFTDRTVRLWDWKSGVCLQVITNEGRPLPISVAFSPDGSRLVVGTAESRIYVSGYKAMKLAITDTEPLRVAAKERAAAEAVASSTATVPEASSGGTRGSSSMWHNARCAKCYRTNQDVLADEDRSGMSNYVIGAPRRIARCPACGSFYCIDHLVYDSSLDRYVCPLHRGKPVEVPSSASEYR